MHKLNVSLISYANSAPFLYGILQSDIINEIELSVDFPSACADKVLSGKADIGLIPIVETLRMKKPFIIPGFCIGADDYVRTVTLCANQPVEKLSRIYLDYQSRTSVVLVKVLAKHHWNIDIEWIQAEKGFETMELPADAGKVIIGDRAFHVNTPYIYDLAHEWKTLTGLPFLFAAWVSSHQLEPSFVASFSQALEYGINHLPEASSFFLQQNPTHIDILSYLKNNINYNFDKDKHRAMTLFLKYAKDLI
jgi:chorismate dehydratase